MKHFTKMAGGVVAVAVLAAPSMASAHSDPSVNSVKAHVRNADQALTMVADRVKANDNAATAIAMVRNLRQTQAATREARRLQGRAKKAKALRLVADQRNDNVLVLSALVDEVSDDAQAAIATALNNNLRGRVAAIERLTSLATTLPAQAQAGIARAIAAISGNPTGVVNIAGALKSGDITPAAEPQLEQALTLASGAMFTGINQLKQIVGMLPAPAQGPVNMAITRVTGILQSIFGNGTPAGATTGGTLSNLPIPTNLPVPCGLPIPKFLPFAKAC
ncbi:MAG TPA: hypothetical protein VGR11_01365 [Solirubrobacteraceae bacterium]|nr:hypothetical protein [Solirubrobacteraceae bacterium]